MARLSIAIVEFGKLHRCILAIGGSSRANDVDACRILARPGTINTQKALELRVLLHVPLNLVFSPQSIFSAMSCCDVRSVVFTPSATWEIKASAWLES